jgi:hypothetical protein
MNARRDRHISSVHCRRSILACRLLLALVPLVFLVACGAPHSPTADISTALSPTSSPSAPTPAPPPTSTPSPPTPVPTPTFTPVPLPEVCLRQKFAADVDACHTASVYDIRLTVDPNTASVTGQQQVRYINAEGQPLSDLYLRLFPNTPAYGGSMTVTRLLLNGAHISPFIEFEGSALRVPLEPPLDAGRMLTLSMAFTVEVPTTGAAGHGLFSYTGGIMALPTVYPIIPVYDDDGWNVEIAPTHGDDLHTDVSSYEVQVTAPSNLTLVASGVCLRLREGVWSCNAGPVRDFVVILGGRYQRAARLVQDVVVNSYFYGEHERAGWRAVEVAADALVAFTDLFGEYPYAELDVVATPNRLGGMEYPGLVVIEDRLYPDGGQLEWLVAHEVAHQWWFGVVGSDQVDTPWLDEALTQYSTLLYYERTYGPDRARGILQDFVQTYRSLVRAGRDRPAGLSAASYDSSLYWDVVYRKGALYFHSLREAVGDETFFDILQTYYDRHRYQIATPESFLATVEDVTGDRHITLYEEWILGASYQPRRTPRPGPAELE